jgi:hypothetical protein
MIIIVRYNLDQNISKYNDTTRLESIQLMLLHHVVLYPLEVKSFTVFRHYPPDHSVIAMLGVKSCLLYPMSPALPVRPRG